VSSPTIHLAVPEYMRCRSDRKTKEKILAVLRNVAQEKR
jgi:hypothetical protein